MAEVLCPLARLELEGVEGFFPALIAKDQSPQARLFGRLQDKPIMLKRPQSRQARVLGSRAYRV